MRQTLIFFLLLGFSISACNLPARQDDTQAATAAALTVEAALQANASLATPTSPLPTATQPIKTPTFAQPVISVGDVVNCRKGPGTSYERITQIKPGESVNIVGFFPPNYWVVASKEGDCWLSGEFATPAGSFAAVPTITAPPTPQGGAPKAATFPKSGWTFYCYGGQADITLSWNDNANNESGYRVLRNGEVIANLPANSTYFAESISLLSGQSAAYQIQAYNGAGEANSSTANIACP